MARLTPAQFMDEVIYRQIRITRYAAGRVRFVRNLVDELNDGIAIYLLKKEKMETKGQVADSRKYIRAKCLEYRERLYNYLQKELRDFVEEQGEWIYANSPVELKKKNPDTIYNNIFFEAFSDNETITAFIQRIFNQILQLWNARLSIAYRTGQPMKDMVKLVLDREVKG